MGKQRCESCGYEFSRKEIRKDALKFFNKPLVCKNCGLEHQLTLLTWLLPRILFTVFPVSIFLYPNIKAVILTLMIITIPLDLLLYPFYSKYRAKK
ncbi:hypothetical protein J7E81_08665 [Bacillus sp. ISL-18]|uniref:TIGR04104 family putative zinc finger protein n=1 Tax=Bacillus sp. ISL-18 TaxID=2819118 RepID=UPI001BEC25F9|nr:TIGR04104 family putative zinc finger protein [Bacillus sp. ISL-18]MBT2655310.1 hypothetical protein [Bacillus sp. ISL-18]